MNDSRYSRQELIEGWNQEVLFKLKAAVVGDGLLGQQILENLVAIGVGETIVIGNSKITGDVRSDGYLSFCSESFGKQDCESCGKSDGRSHHQDKSIPHAVKLGLSKVNPSVKVFGIHWYPAAKSIEAFLDDVDVIFDATNNPLAKRRLFEYSKRAGKFLVSGYCEELRGGFFIMTKEDNAEDEKKISELEQIIETQRRKAQPHNEQGKDKTQEIRQGIIPSMILGGLMVEEARKHFMPYDKHETAPLKTMFWYNLLAHDRFSRDDDCSLWKCGEDKSTEQILRNKSVLIVGAGALGTPAALAYLLLNAGDLRSSLGNIGKITIMDYDTPNESNLARQIFYYDSLGRPKSITLTEKLRRITSESYETSQNISQENKTQIKSINGKLVRYSPADGEEPTDYKLITLDDLKKMKFDLIVSCVDNFSTRLLLNQLSTKFAIPLVHGGTSYSSAKVALYVPNALSVPSATSCPNCLFGFKYLAKEEVDRDSCDNVFEPSIITTSKICAGLMVGESLLLLSDSYRSQKEDSPNDFHNHFINGYIAYDTFESTRIGIVRAESVCECGKK